MLGALLGRKSTTSSKKGKTLKVGFRETEYELEEIPVAADLIGKDWGIYRDFIELWLIIVAEEVCLVEQFTREELYFTEFPVDIDYSEACTLIAKWGDNTLKVEYPEGLDDDDDENPLTVLLEYDFAQTTLTRGDSEEEKRIYVICHESNSFQQFNPKEFVFDGEEFEAIIEWLQDIGVKTA